MINDWENNILMKDVVNNYYGIYSVSVCVATSLLVTKVAWKYIIAKHTWVNYIESTSLRQISSSMCLFLSMQTLHFAVVTFVSVTVLLRNLTKQDDLGRAVYNLSGISCFQLNNNSKHRLNTYIYENEKHTIMNALLSAGSRKWDFIIIFRTQN